jgi:outer membrane protein W
MNNKRIVSMLIVFAAMGFVSHASAAKEPGSYLALKGGIYSPSATFDLSNVETTFDGDTETGVAGEIAFGHHVLPTLVMELGVGYFKGSGSVETSSRREDLDFDVIPVILSAKALIPVGSVDPYGEFGIGAYFTEFDAGNNLNTLETTTTFGIHAGAGINVGITQHAFIGAEGRYVWAEPSFGDQTITLNDGNYELNGFELNGFTTTLVLGYCF